MKKVNSSLLLLRSYRKAKAEKGSEIQAQLSTRDPCMSNIHRANMACVLLPHIQTPAIDGKPTTATSSDIIAATHPHTLAAWLVGWLVGWLRGAKGNVAGKSFGDVRNAVCMYVCPEGSSIKVKK